MTFDGSRATTTAAALGLNDAGQILIAAAGTTDGTTCPPQGSGS
jgi:hypothetical protein